MPDSSSEQRELWDQIAAGYSPDDAVETEAIAPTLDFLAELTGNGTALEFAVGGGRIAVPLHRRGVRVAGQDVSPAMIDVLHAPGRDHQVVYIVYNAITCLLYQDEQIACFQNAARHLKPGGCFVIEVWVPQLRQLPVGQTLVPATVTDARLIIDSYDLVTQRLFSHHYKLENGIVTEAGGTPHRYVWPSEMDVMAKMAGLELAHRYADWSKSEFTGESKSSISVWPSAINAGHLEQGQRRRRDPRRPHRRRCGVGVRPQGIAGEEVSWWWNPLSYIADEVKAVRLAEHFAAKSRDPTAKTDASFDPAAQDLLAGMLLAAALDQRPLTQVYTWLARPGDAAPVDRAPRPRYPLTADQVDGVIRRHRPGERAADENKHDIEWVAGINTCPAATHSSVILRPTRSPMLRATLLHTPQSSGWWPRRTI